MDLPLHAGCVAVCAVLAVTLLAERVPAGGQSPATDEKAAAATVDKHGSAPRPGPACVALGDLATATAAPVNRDVCVQVHVYDVVELADGTRFLDVCPGTVPDEDCRFILLSRPADREEVGDLWRYKGEEIRLRGTLRSMHGRLGMVISHGRQFRGGPEKFRPNPRLLRDFDGDSEVLPVRDPNLRGGGHARSFMNGKEREAVTTGKP